MVEVTLGLVKDTTAHWNMSVKNSEVRENLVAYWSVPLRDGVHTVEFEHGSTSGKRVLRVDGKVS